MKAALILGHLGKPKWEPGAVCDLDGDGVEPDEMEALLVLRYSAGAVARLLELGHQPLVLADGTYTERAARARAWGAEIVVHLHLDVRNDPRGVVLYDPESPADRGPALANLIARGLDARVTELAPSRAWAATPTASPGGAAIVSLHRRDAAPVIVYEPARAQDVARWLTLCRYDKVEALGLGLADGVHAWSKRGAAAHA